VIYLYEDNRQPSTSWRNSPRKAPEAPRQLAAANWQGTPPSGQPGARRPGVQMEWKVGFWDEKYQVAYGHSRNNCEKTIKHLRGVASKGN